MAEIFINLYDDEQTEIFVTEEGWDPTKTSQYGNLGESKLWELSNIGAGLTSAGAAFQNSNFLEMHVYDASDNFIVTLNSGKPLLIQPSTGKYYFGEYHYHDGTYMVGKKHTPIPHEKLELVRENQLIPFSHNPENINEINSSFNIQKYVVKLSQIFEILKNLPNVTVTKDTLYKIKYGVFTDILQRVAVLLWKQEQVSGDIIVEEDIGEGQVN